MIRINGIEVKIKHYPDGTQRYEGLDKIIGDYFYAENYRNCTVIWKYESEEELFAICCLKDWIDRELKDKNTILYLPYIPNARMDRVKNCTDVFTLNTFCKIINSLKFDKVKVLDAHSNVSLALLDNCENDTPEYIINGIENNYDLVFYPDEGSSKRYSDLIDKPYMFGVKKRNWENGKIEGLDVITNGNDYKGKDILIIDDICSYGGTIYYSAKKLKEMGVNNIYVFVTHCENSIFDGKLINSGLIKKIYTTDSILPIEAEEDEPLIEIFGI